MAEQATCKHENSTGKKYCPDCGKEMDDSMQKLAGLVADELEKRMKEKPKGEGSEDYETELDRILRRKKAKK